MNARRVGLLLAAGAMVAAAGCGERMEATMSETLREGDGPEADGTLETATFAAGCFWGVEAAFRKVEGVVETEVGYTGGHTELPTYRDVCSQSTGHAEAVRIRFDPEKVTYKDLLDRFWAIHNPTTLNRQGPDVGDQYRSAVFFHTPEQAEAARASKAALEGSGRFDRPVVTEITPAGVWHRGEEYHQRYHEKHGRAGCASTIRD